MMAQVREMVAYLPDLWRGLTDRVWPDDFFRVSMGLPDRWIGWLPALARGYLLVYLLMAVLGLALRYGKKQRCVSSLRQKLTDLFLTMLTPLLVRMIAVIFQVGQELAGKVPGGFAFSLGGLDWLGKVVCAWFFPIGICLILLVILLMPFQAVWRYLREYGPAGLVWSVYDVGFGYVCLSSSLLVMDTGDPVWYIPIAVAAVLILAGQIGGARRD